MCDIILKGKNNKQFALRLVRSQPWGQISTDEPNTSDVDPTLPTCGLHATVATVIEVAKKAPKVEAGRTPWDDRFPVHGRHSTTGK